MTNQEMFARIEDIGIIPAVRVASAEDALFAAGAVFGGGIPIVEITMTVPGAIGVIAELRRRDPDAIVGAGTVLDLDTARTSIEAGAMFLTSTGLDREIVNFCEQHNVPVIPGVLTPSELMMAIKAGADFVKLFPCAAVGGASYIRALKGPFPGVRLLASGGVNQQTAADFIRAGASAIGVGRDLLPKEAIQKRNLEWIHELARRFLAMVHDGRTRR